MISVSKLAMAAITAAGMAGSALADTVIVVSVGESRFAAKVEDTETGRAFLAKLPLTLSMTELNGNEKYAYGVSLPTAAQYYSKIEAGDLMLYGSNCLVLFYGSAGGYSYTRIGKLVSTVGLAAAVGSGSAVVTFEEAVLKATIKMDGGEAEVGVETNLPASVAITKLAATTLPAAKSDWRDYATLTDKERALCRFFKLKAELD